MFYSLMTGQKELIISNYCPADFIYNLNEN